MSTRNRPVLAAAAAASLLVALSACGSDNQVAADPATTSATTSAPTTTGSSTGTYPLYAPTDYTYRLQVMCYCPLVGPVDITVKNGQVADARIVGGQHKGGPVPISVRKTINDIIAIANDPKSGDVKVDWPAGADVPRSVAVNPIQRASDAGVTYVIRNVNAG
ncbi:MAG TPA: DUF6174 domain-containing protein [Nocardioides sp.]|nr:DUF6174 domain-containing protein [Nocardioides sp.]